MNKSFKRWTIGAVIAVVICVWSLWWAGSTSGATGVCNAAGLQPVQDCISNRAAHPWYVLLAIATAFYLGFYIARIRRILKSSAARSATEHRDTDDKNSPGSDRLVA